MDHDGDPTRPKRPAPPPEPEGSGTETPPARDPTPTTRLPDLSDITFEPRPVPSPPAPPGTEDEEAGLGPVVVEPPSRPAERRVLSRRRSGVLSAAADALIPSGSGLPGARELRIAERLDESVPGWDPRARRSFERALRLIGWWTVATRARPFRTIPARARARVLDRMGRSRDPFRRAAAALVRSAIADRWAASARVEEQIRYTYECADDGPPRQTPTLEVISYPQVLRAHEEECDVVVVGSGAGGGVVAKELAEVGLSVIVVEEGQAFTQEGFSGTPFQRRQRLYRQNGWTRALGVPAVPIPMGMAVGGSTVVGAGTSMRPSDEVLMRWEKEGGLPSIDPATMSPFFERVERLMQVQPVPGELLGANATTLEAGLRRAGVQYAPAQRTIEGCRGCGTCTVGCPSGAKLGTHLTYLPRAQRAGTTIFANARVDRIMIEDGRARGVVASMLDPRSREPRTSLTVRAKVVVIATGAIHTPALLAGSAIGGRSGQLGANLRLHPHVPVTGFFEEDVFAWRGTLQAMIVDEWHGSHDLLVALTARIPSLSAGDLPGTGDGFARLLASLPRAVGADVHVTDSSTGRVRRGRGQPLVSYRLNAADTRRLVRGVVNVAGIMFGAGAAAVATGIAGHPVVTSSAELEAIGEEAVKPGALTVRGHHPTGTARMGTDPETSVSDAWGEVHGVPGLFVADASLLPGPPGVPPQTTVMALATRTADHIVRTGSRYF